MPCVYLSVLHLRERSHAEQGRGRQAELTFHYCQPGLSYSPADTQDLKEVLSTKQDRERANGRGEEKAGTLL